MEWGDKIRNAGSFSVSRETSGTYALGFMLLVVGIYCLLGLEFYWRTPDLIGFYFWEAMVAMLSPFILYGLADIYVMETYRETGYQIRNNYVVHMIMDDERCEHIRRSGRFNPLLMWQLPRPVRNVRRQLANIALWYGALTHPEGSPSLKAQREPLMLGAAMWILLVGIPLLVLPMMSSGGAVPRWMVLLMLGLLALGSLLAGLVMLKRSAVQMALADFIDGETYDKVL